MNSLVKHIARFIGLILIQTLVLNQIEIGLGIQIMVYPLFVLLLPVEMKVIPLMLVAFAMGLLIDSMSNTYGLHASSLLLFAYTRPMIFKMFAPRDDYDPLLETHIFDMGRAWFIRVFGILLLIHHFWFFLLEMFRFDEIFYILQKTALSVIISFIFCILLQYLFIRNRKENAI